MDRILEEAKTRCAVPAAAVEDVCALRESSRRRRRGAVAPSARSAPAAMLTLGIGMISGISYFRTRISIQVVKANFKLAIPKQHVNT